MTRTIEIEVAAEKRTIIATFSPVRRGTDIGAVSELGWAQLSDEDYGYRFPAIVTRATNARGYSVYTVADWQAPDSTFGDLSDSYDWATLTLCGTGRFTGTAAKSSASGIDITPFRLPVTPEQWDDLAADFGPARVGVTIGDRPRI